MIPTADTRYRFVNGSDNRPFRVIRVGKHLIHYAYVETPEEVFSITPYAWERCKVERVNILGDGVAAEKLVAELARLIAVVNTDRAGLPGLNMPEAYINDRARNIAAALLATYSIKEI
jgi:hypothetical protein